MPGTDDGLGAGVEIQWHLMQQVCSAAQSPAESYLLQKLYVIRAQEQQWGDAEDSFNQ